MKANCQGACQIRNLYVPGYNQAKCVTCGRGWEDGEEIIINQTHKMENTHHPVHAVYDGRFNTKSGRIIDLRNPKPEMINIRDIAAGLSNVCRFGGQISQFYSVAQHSCLVARMVGIDHKKEALLHDAAEAYLGDIIKPLKVLLPEYTGFEDRFMAVIIEVFELDPKKLEAVKAYDKIALEYEHAMLQKGETHVFEFLEEFFQVPDCERGIWTPQQACKGFLQSFERIFGIVL